MTASFAGLHKYKYPVNIPKMLSPSYFIQHDFNFMLKPQHKGWLESNTDKSSLLPFIDSPSPSQ